MPVHKSPKKMMRRDLKAKMRNKAQKSALKTQHKKFLVAMQTNSVTEELFRVTQGALARAGQKGIIHRNKASRLIGKMMKHMQQAVV